jgi:uncharacterized repeat protein (TIGR02543 family)
MSRRSPAGLTVEYLETRTLLADYGVFSADDWVVTVGVGSEQADAVTRAGSSRLVKSGPGSLVLDRSNAHSGGVLVHAGTLVVRHVDSLGSGTLTVGPGARVVFDVGAADVRLAGLTIEVGGFVDLGRGQVTLPPSAYSLTDVVAALKNGRAGGSWTGTSGFTTRHARSVPGGGLGYVVHADGSLDVGFAVAGDANLDGTVDHLDMAAILASNKLDTGAAGFWFEGDFNYDGVIDDSDIAALSGSPFYNAGAYAPKLPDPNQRNLTQDLVPTKVFDAKADFGAVGDNVADDTAKVQACIDAARRWGDGAIAYFPKGTYKVTSTINVTGGNYLIGGASPIHTRIQGHGAANPVVLITDPGNLRLEFIDIRHTDQLKTAIRQVSSDSTVPSRIHYDHVYLNAYGTSFVNARTFTGSSGMALEVKDLSSESVLTGYNVNPQLKGMSFDNVSDAQVLFSQIGTMGWGALRISGTEAERDGFFGILNGYTSYRIADNHSLVISDGYQEQMRPENTPDVKYIATPYMIMSGSPDLPAGRVTVSSNKFDGAGARSGLINSSSPPYETYFTVDNYHGVLSHVVSDYKNGSATFDPNKQAFKIVTSGTAPFDVLLMANTYEQGPTGSGPVVEGGSNVNRHLLANWAPALTPSGNKQVPNVTNANTLPLAGQALDDFRRLGSFDLLLNYDIDSPTFPRPTPEQAATYPELPELNWQKRSDWLDVTALPASVNGGRSAVGDGIADDTAAILAACNEVRKSNGRWSTVYLPPGTYKITSTLHPTEGLSSTVDTHLSMRGHGKSTRIVWHGPENGRMFRSDSNTSSSFIGIVWDGRSIAAQGFIHDTSSSGRRETKVLHQYEAFLNFRKEGAGTASGKPDQRYLESSSYRNCIFINCGTGLAVMQSNDFMINVEGCHFYDNGIGVYANNGEFLIRNSRFFRSSQFDIMNDNSAPNSSIRRVSSVGSNAFYRRRGTTVSISSDQQATLQDCYVADWKNTSFAIQNMAQGATGWDPILIFDCTFENAPSSNPPIRLDRAAQVVHSNNTWTVGGQARTGAQLFAGQVANLQAVPHTPSARPATHTVSFDAQGGTAPGPASKRVTAGSAYGPLATTSRLGHTFAGWWTAPGGGGTQVTDVTNVALSSAQTLYAKWAPSSVHTVTFDPQGGATPSPATASVTFNAAYGPLATTTRPDHTFEGWWTGPGGTGTLVTATTQVTTAANHTLYAKWATATAGFRYWDNSGGTANDWGGLANWSTVAAGGTNPVALPGTADVAAFSATPIAGTAQTVNLNANRSVLGLAVTATRTATTALLGGGTNRTLTIGASGITNAGSGSLVIGSGTSGQSVSVTLAGSQRIAANGSGGISFSNTIAGTGSPTLTNVGTGTGYVGLGTLQSTVGRIVQDSATSKLGLRANNSGFTGGVEIRKGTVLIGTHPSNLGASTSIVILGNPAGGSDAATLEVNDNSSPAPYANPIVLASNTQGLLRIVLRDDTGRRTHTFSGGITGHNDLTIENQAEGANNDDTLIFTSGAINHSGTITHVGTGSGDLIINSVIGTHVTGVIQDSATSRLVLNGANTYSGDTVVNAGTLVVNGNAIPNSGTLIINGGGRVDPSGATETVESLFFGEVQQGAGTWGSTASTAANRNDTYFIGSGVISVASGPESANLLAWTGAGLDGRWSNPDNWQGGVIPQSGARLFFPTTSVDTASTNDLPPGIRFASIAVQEGGPRLFGNAVALHASDGEGLSLPGGGIFALPVVLTQPATIGVSAGSLDMLGPIDTAGHTLTIEGGGSTVIFAAPITNAGRLVIEGGATVALAAANTSGDTTVTSGAILVQHPRALGIGRLEVGADAVVTLDHGPTRTIVTSLILDTAGRVEVGTGGLSIAAGGISATALRQGLVTGRNGGGWDGRDGFVSSDAPSSGGRGGFAVGYRVAADDSATVAWASLGDADLDGAVTTADVNAILTSALLNTGIPGATWQQGDFDYDGLLTTADLNALLTTGRLNTGSYLPPGTEVQTASFGFADPAAERGISAPVGTPIDTQLRAWAAFGVAGNGISEFSGGAESETPGARRRSLGGFRRFQERPTADRAWSNHGPTRRLGN